MSCVPRGHPVRGAGWPAEPAAAGHCGPGPYPVVPAEAGAAPSACCPFRGARRTAGSRRELGSSVAAVVIFGPFRVMIAPTLDQCTVYTHTRAYQVYEVHLYSENELS